MIVFAFLVQYARTSPNLWSFVVSAPDRNAYIAMGFSPNGLMVGSSAIVGWMSTTGTGTIKQYQLSGRSSDQVFPDQGNLQLNSSIIISQSQFQRLYLIFQLNTQQPLTRVIYAVGPSSVFPTSPNFALSEHSDKASTALNYVTGKNWCFFQLYCLIYFFIHNASLQSAHHYQTMYILNAVLLYNRMRCAFNCLLFRV